MSAEDRQVGAAASHPAKRGALVSAAELDRRRTAYYVLILCENPLAIAVQLVHAPPVVTVVLCLLAVGSFAAFLWVFLKTARLAGLSVLALVPIALLLLIPGVGLVTLMVVDFHIADTVDRGVAPAARPRLSRLSYWSLIMAWLPIIGLPMAAVAVWQTSASRGMLTGRGLAIAGLVVNTLVAIVIVAAIVTSNT